MKKKAVFSWSTGKDSALALQKILQENEYEIVSLVTTVTEDYDRVSMHGLRVELLDRQAESLEIPLRKIYIPGECTNDLYEHSFCEAITGFRDSGVGYIVFGDIFLEDVRNYRLKLMNKIGMNCVFPIWQEKSEVLADRFIEQGFRAKTICVDSKALDKRFCGREYDTEFLAQLPENIDKCGENGEFHTFAYSGPIFSEKVACKTGEIVLRNERFYYCDIVPQ